MMYTDPNASEASLIRARSRATWCSSYLDVFDSDKAGLQAMKEHYVRGGLGDSVVKKRLEAILQELIAPIRARREEYAQDKGEVLRMLQEGTRKARETAAATCDEVKAALGLSYFS
jgi:tryptophanyl-tRNA synthetase